MKVCMPTMSNTGLKDMIGEHFGRVPTYTIIDSESNEFKVIENTSEHMGGKGYPPEIMQVAGVEVMICSGLGRRAVQMFEQMGIMVYVGASGSVQNAIDLWKNGHLQAATNENACKQHAFHNSDNGKKGCQ